MRFHLGSASARVGVGTALALFAVPCVASAQRSPTPPTRVAHAARSAETDDARGVRRLGYRSIIGADGSVWVAATTDGLVEVWTGAATATASQAAIDTAAAREFYAPAEIAPWADSVELMLRDPAAGRDRDGRAPILGSDRRRLQRTLQVSEANATTPGRLMSVELAGCAGIGGGSGVHVHLPVDGVGELLKELRAAAAEASRAPAARGDARQPDGRPYWRGAVACAATPLEWNPGPRMPAVPAAERYARELWAGFVVDTSGTVITRSIRFVAGTDPRFAAAARAAIERWRYTPPTRGGRRISQGVYAPIRFDPVAEELEHHRCAVTSDAAIVVSAAPPNASLGAREPRYFAALARRVSGLSRLPPVGRSIRLTLHRQSFQPVTNMHLSDGASVGPLSAELANDLTAAVYPGRHLPASYTGDSLGLVIDVVRACPEAGAARLEFVEVRAIAESDGWVRLSYAIPHDITYHVAGPLLRRDALTPRALTTWADSIQQWASRIEQLGPPRGHFAPEYIPGSPLLGYPSGTGIRLGLTVAHRAVGGMECGRSGFYFLNVQLRELPTFLQLLRRAAARASRQTPHPGTGWRSRVHAPHEVACPAVPSRANALPAFPPNVPESERESRAVGVQFVIDSAGTVEAASVRVMAGTDARFAAAVETTVRGWRFTPAISRGRLVRQSSSASFVFVPEPGGGHLPTVFAKMPGRARAQPDSTSEAIGDPNPPPTRTIFYRGPARQVRPRPN